MENDVEGNDELSKERYDMKLSSTDFDDGGQLDTRHGKKFDNVSPQLAWTDLPSGTGSLALTMIDTDPVARGYVHWFVDGIPAVDGQFDSGVGGAVPAGRELTPYAGPFPPSGTHEYVFTLYALDPSAPELSAKTAANELPQVVSGHVLATSELKVSFTNPNS
ncbi:Raf kinase inhibitor-like YbhB/YbcL family protein [Agromyces albus]|nr:Raf kinase inhibitor-like YbhB/YbcL family protein [Agromyces albus]